jgi:NUMOD3 motif-containing protein
MVNQMVDEAKTRQWKVYWFHAANHTDPRIEGYVGATRLLSLHKRNSRMPSDFLVTILHRGTAAECLAFESRMRPEPNIGWNVARGGFRDGTGLHGANYPHLLSHTEKTKRLMSAKAKARANTPEGRERMRKAALALGGRAWLGRQHKDESKAILSAKAKQRSNTPEGRERLRQAALSQGKGVDHPRYGQRHTDAAKAKIAASRRRLKISPAERTWMAERQ